MQQLLRPLLQRLQPVLTDSLLLPLTLLTNRMIRIMQFLLALIEDIERVVLEVNKEDVFHFIGDFVKEASDVLMTVVIVEDPSEAFVDTDDVVMQLVLVNSIVRVQLFLELGLEDLISEEIVHGVGNLLNVQVNVTFEVFVTNRVQKFVPSFAFLRKDGNQNVKIFDQQRNFQSDNLDTKIFLDSR